MCLLTSTNRKKPLQVVFWIEVQPLAQWFMVAFNSLRMLVKINNR